MTGLIIKDLKLLKAQRNFFLLFIAMAIVMQINMENASFIIGYMTLCGSMAVLNTISYDEFDNGNPFLFSLPISRKGYALEKYIFGFITGGASLLLAVIVSIIFGIVKNTFSAYDTAITAIVYLSLLAIMLSVMLPIQLKFGGEKRMYVIFAGAGVFAVFGFLALKGSRLLGIDLDSLAESLSTVSSWVMALSAAAIAALAVLISIRISISIMNKKEF